MIDICCNLNSLKLIDDNAISGKLYMEVGTQKFPSKGWTDLPVAVLTLWMDELADTKDVYCKTFHFLEGPFSFKIIRKFGIAYFRAYHGDNMLFQEQIDYLKFEKIMFFTSYKLMFELYERGWGGIAVAALTRRLHAAISHINGRPIPNLLPRIVRTTSQQP